MSGQNRSHAVMSQRAKQPVHPYATIFPRMGEHELRELAADIKRHGLREPIILYKGEIVDGQNREEACWLAGVAPKFAAYAGREDDLLSWIVSRNLHRRHLTPSQHALVAADAAAKAGISTRAAAVIAGIQPRHAQYARVVVDEGVEPLKDMVRKGELSVFDAHKLARHRGPTKQRRLAALGPEACHAEAAKIVHGGAEQEASRRAGPAPPPTRRGGKSRPAQTIWHELLRLDRDELSAERNRLPVLARLLDAMIARLPPKGTAAAYISLPEFEAMLREARK